MAASPSIEQRLIDQGLLIEAGWIGLRNASVSPDAPPIQLEEMRNSFFAGAHHVFQSILVALEPGAEPTDNDLRRFDLIQIELDTFIAAYAKRHGLVEVQ